MSDQPSAGDGCVGAAGGLTADVPADSKREERGEEHAFGCGLVAARHIVDVQLRFELAKEQLDFPRHAVDLRGNGGGKREDEGAGSDRIDPVSGPRSNGDEAELEMAPSPVALGVVAIY